MQLLGDSEGCGGSVMQTKETKAGYGPGRAAVGEVVDLLPPQVAPEPVLLLPRHTPPRPRYTCHTPHAMPARPREPEAPETAAGRARHTQVQQAHGTV
jgi:hypothetical protein